jgi:AcrR family transcriptional regulator
VQGLTLRACAQLAGVSHGAPAHHFGNIAGLLTEFAIEGFERLSELMSLKRNADDDERQSSFATITCKGIDLFMQAIEFREFGGPESSYRRPRIQL